MDLKSIIEYQAKKINDESELDFYRNLFKHIVLMLDKYDQNEDLVFKKLIEKINLRLEQNIDNKKRKRLKKLKFELTTCFYRFVNHDRYINQRIFKSNFKLAQNEIVILDFETTGNGEKASITEIGALKIKNGYISDVFHTLVNPETKINPYIVNKIGINYEMIKYAPKIEEVIEDFLKFINVEYLMAHNANFDKGFLERALKKTNKSLEYSMVDSIRILKEIELKTNSYSLGKLCKKFNIKFKYHHAVEDCYAVALILKKCIKFNYVLNSDHIFVKKS